MDIHTVTASGIRMKLLTRTISVVLENGGTMMPDREKVIKGLELCSNILGCIGSIDPECPYALRDGGCRHNVLLSDALAMLKEQEAQIEQLEHDLAVTQNNLNYYVNGND